MSSTASWHEANAAYLARALADLRARLERRAQAAGAVPSASEPAPSPSTPPTASVPPPSPSGAPKPERRSFWERLLGSPSTPVAKPLPALAAAPAARLADEANGGASEESPAAPWPADEPPPALLVLSKLLGLSAFEREILLLCVATELDTSIGQLCGRAQGDPSRRYPTFALALALFDEPSWDALSPEHPLRHWRLLEIHQAPGQALTVSPLRADERIVNYVKGLNHLDDRLGSWLSAVPMPARDSALAPSQQDIVDQIVRSLRERATQHLLVTQLLGADKSAKRAVAARAASTLGLDLYALPASALPSQAAELENWARLWERESALLPIALYVDHKSAEGETEREESGSPLARLLARTGGVLFVDTLDAWRNETTDPVCVEVGRPSAAEQKAAWAAALGPAAGNIPELLAGQFNLAHSTIEQLTLQALSDAGENTQTLADRLWAACSASTRPKLDSLAQRLEPKAGWEDLVLPAPERELLLQIAAQVAQRSRVYEGFGFGNKMSRGLGISVLFAGDAGVGKTMAAEVMAKHLKLNLYRIDLSAVVSKYIGETEKSLRRVFDAAEDGGAILFFDEADALFGKRSEVKDSHDRYANIEVNYLLQRLESYRGLAILASNMKSALDPAFLRRLRFVVNFPFPASAERKAIWERAFPPGAPTASLDFERLARLNLTGANIHSIALNAAFTAAHTGAKIDEAMLLSAARTELRKLGRVVNELTLRPSGKNGARP
jgi:hypothetical protein